jgi:hypothetical protein
MLSWAIEITVSYNDDGSAPNTLRKTYATAFGFDYDVWTVQASEFHGRQDMTIGEDVKDYSFFESSSSEHASRSLLNIPSYRGSL